MRAVKILVLLVILTLTGGCAWMPSWLGSGPSPGRGTPADLYRTGIEYYQAGRYKKAITQFTRLREEYPLSQYATLAELGVADSHFSAGDYLMAEANYREFTAMRPTNENIPYVMYQVGMCSYNQMLGVDRDQMRTRMAKADFENLLARFPNSRFSFMAEQKLRECLRRLGEHEFYVGHFYYKRGEYEAAQRRFETIQQQYPNLGLDYKVSYFLNETRRKLAGKTDA
ncbi:MAG: outer membrane protein assembly factor BamD [Syntrophales bacterium]|jgi:outer membrane protein assembly factor BamD|nr:outer membrane protein assembly factor BamD [Syntrophales bacterium]MCK9528858.1 outer membrane protein assembly factor BamD [Syntrophales bacterium]MDX9921168.1 outer membrane protein assembly factor BamD [Syntrophales bacterium]